MQLTHTDNLLKDCLQNKTFDTYAVRVYKSGDSKSLYSENCNSDTLFDIASMGKVLVTSTLILGAVTDGLLSLEDTLPRFFDNVPDDKKCVSVKMLLTHTSGISRYDVPHEVLARRIDVIADDILSKPLAFTPGTNYVYSCTGFMLLGFILEKVYDKTLDELFYLNIKARLGLKRSRFNIAIDEENSAVCYNREHCGLRRLDDAIVLGMRGGVAGNGGEFYTLDDIDTFIKAVLSRSDKLYSLDLFDKAEKNYTPDYSEGRGLGYLVVDNNYRQTGDLFPVGSFGHCGHTGTSFFVNRKLDLYVIILTNATRFARMKNNFVSYDYGEVMLLREQIHNSILSDLISEGLI